MVGRSAEAQAGLMAVLADSVRQQRGTADSGARLAVATLLLQGCVGPVLEMTALMLLLVGGVMGLVGWMSILLVIGLGCVSSGIVANSGYLIGRHEGAVSTGICCLDPCSF